MSPSRSNSGTSLYVWRRQRCCHHSNSCRKSQEAELRCDHAQTLVQTQVDKAIRKERELKSYILACALRRAISLVAPATSFSAVTSAASASSPFLEECYPGVIWAWLERLGDPRRLIVAENALCLLQRIWILIAAEKVVICECIL
jgi:hypothetical protein